MIRKAKGLQEVRDNGLKLFLEKDDLERLYDFEEECVEGYFHEQNEILLQSTDQRIRNTDDRVENMSQKIEDINQKENLQSISVTNMEFRVRKMEENMEQILSHLAVIHRFMTQQTYTTTDNMANFGNPPIEEQRRIRTMSESDTGPTYQTTRKKFNRSLTEVRPDAYIFDDGSHYEVRTVIEENEMIQSNEDMVELMNSLRNRKLSTQSEEPEYVENIHPAPPIPPTPPILESNPLPPTNIPRSDSLARKTPNLSVRQDTKESTSTESKDTLTPLETCEEKTVVATNEEGGEVFPDGLRQRAIKRRNSILGRRNSESYSNYDINRSQQSLNMIGLCKRQFSLTQSEPDSDGAPTNAASKPIPIKNRHHLLLQFHTEYTSITDELESVCHMIASPTTSLMEEKQKDLNELSTPEFAAMMEKQHLKECEDDDYQIMGSFFQGRDSMDDSDETGESGNEYGSRRMLRRETAIELPISPAKMMDETQGDNQEYHINNERHLNRGLSGDGNYLSPLSYSNQNSPRNSTYLPGNTYLNPPTDTPRFYIKSNESLHKHSSTDTEYSMHPYRVIKQSSNDTNSSFNIDNSSIANDLSMEGESTVNTTVIENTAEERGMTKRAATLGSSDIRSSFLRKQFSMDHGRKTDSRPVSEHLDLKGSGVSAIEAFTVPPPPPTLHSPTPPTPVTPSAQIPIGMPPKIPSNSRLQTMNVLKESSSTSTEDTREIHNVPVMPSISTNIVQDEIAKLSSNIKNSESDIQSPSLNETMC